MRLSITHIDVFHVAVPLIGEGFRNAYGNTTRQHSIIVRVHAGDHTGLGNVDPLPGYSPQPIGETLRALRSELAPLLIGRDAGNIADLVAAMDSVSPEHSEAKASIEMACCDVFAKALNLPLHQLMGGAVKNRLLLNGWIGIVAPDQAARDAEAWQRAGFRSIKIKLGGGTQGDRDRVQAVREVVGPDMPLRGDANAHYSVAESIELGRLLEPCQLQLLEQPVAADDLQGLARVRQAISTPIMADESITDHRSLIEVIRHGCADVVKFKIMKQGGLLQCKHMMETASAAGLKIVIGHGFGLSVSSMAELMLAATNADVLDGVECVGPLKMRDDVTKYRLDLSNGSIELGSEPGIGMELSEDKLQQYLVEA